MRLRHAIGTLVLALTMGAAVPAAHAQYPPTVGAGRVTRSEVKQCQCTMFSGEGFEPGATVTVYDRGPDGVRQRLGTTVADDEGKFTFKVCFDEHDDEGEHTLSGVGRGANGATREVRANVRVEGSVCYRHGDEVHNPNVIGGDDDDEEPGNGNGNGGAGLPRTGAGYVLPGLLLGFALVVSGTGIVHLTRRRRLVTG